MRSLVAWAAVVCCASSLSAAEIRGEYLEARSCSVYTGPCFANAELGQAGKEAVLAWKIDAGRWQGVPLDGLAVALVVTAENTLGYDGVFDMQPGKTESVILVDEQATPVQTQALVAFVRDSAGELARKVVKVQQAPVTLENDHLDGRGVLRAGDVARIETRALTKKDNVCCNETTFYLPLTPVENSSPAFVNVMSYTGEALGRTWTNRNERSAFLATFRR